MESAGIYINAVTCLNVMGDHGKKLLHGSVVAPVAVPFAEDIKAHLLRPPSLPAGVFDRKVQRNIEPQAHRILWCVAALVPVLHEMNIEPAALGLTAAVPEVDAPSPGWEAVQAIHEQPDQMLSRLFANTPPLHALMLLNSSVMAYSAEACQCHGAMAGFCAQNNAGVDALIEAAEQLRTGITNASVVISGSPNITPAIYLRRPADNTLRGEGAAALIMSRGRAGSSARFLAAARAFALSDDNRDSIVGRLIEQVLRASKTSPEGIAFVIASPRMAESMVLPGKAQIYASTMTLTGDLGPSTPLTDIALAIELFRDGHAEATATGLLLTDNDAGHCGAILLSGADAGGSQ